MMVLDGFRAKIFETRYQHLMSFINTIDPIKGFIEDNLNGKSEYVMSRGILFLNYIGYTARWYIGTNYNYN